MEKRIIILPILLLIATIGLIPLANAQWSWNICYNQTACYNNVYNLTVNNWNYTANYSNAIFTGDKTKFVLLNLTNVSNPLTLGIVGYSKSLQNLGAINWYLIQQKGSNITILLSNQTIQNVSWNLASIFYNPLGNGFNVSITGHLLNPNSNITTVKAVQLEVIGNIAKNLKINNLYVNSTTSNALINFSINSSYSKALVVLGSSSLTNRYFNLTYSPNFYHTFLIQSNIANSVYSLKDSAGSLTLTNSPLQSNNANFIFSRSFGYDNVGFESYLDTQISANGNWLIAESMYADQIGYIHNSSTKKPYGLSILNPTGYISMTVNDLTAPFPTFIFLPAFTRNYTLTSAFTNPNVTITNYTTFRYKIPILNINWTYDYTTYANFASQGIANTLVSKTQYIIINLTHYQQMNNYCQSIYLSAFNPATNQDMGSVPFTILNCSVTSNTLRILALNQTSYGALPYNDLYVYFNNTAGATGFSNSLILNQWQLGNGNNLLITGNYPYLIQLSQPLSNIDSFIRSETMYPDREYAQIAFNGVINRNYVSANCTAGGCVIFNTNPLISNNSKLITNILVTNTLGESGIITDINEFITPYLTAYQDTEFTGYLSRGYNISNHYAMEGYQWINQVNISLINNNAQVNKLYTSNYIKGNVIQNIGGNYNLNCTHNNLFCLPSVNYTNTIPFSNSTLNYNHTTTVDFSSNALSANVLVGGIIPVQKYILIFISIICVILGGITFNTGENGHYSFIFIIIALWVMGIWVFPILVLGLIISVIFIIYELHHKGIL